MDIYDNAYFLGGGDDDIMQYASGWDLSFKMGSGEMNTSSLWHGAGEDAENIDEIMKHLDYDAFEKAIVLGAGPAMALMTGGAEKAKRASSARWKLNGKIVKQMLGGEEDADDNLADLIAQDKALDKPLSIGGCDTCGGKGDANDASDEAEESSLMQFFEDNNSDESASKYGSADDSCSAPSIESFFEM